jgi:hypothetical protein
MFSNALGVQNKGTLVSPCRTTRTPQLPIDASPIWSRKDCSKQCSRANLLPISDHELAAIAH